MKKILLALLLLTTLARAASVNVTNLPTITLSTNGLYVLIWPNDGTTNVYRINVNTMVATSQGTANGLTVSGGALTNGNSGAAEVFSGTGSYEWFAGAQNGGRIYMTDATSKWGVIGMSNGAVVLGFSSTNGTGATNFVTLMSSGNVGIGTGTPAAALSVVGGISVTTTSLFGGNIAINGNVGFGIAPSANAIYIYKDTSSSAVARFDSLNADGYGVLIQTADTGNDKYALKVLGNSGNSELLYVGNGGNVGIGTGTPTAKVELYEGVTNALYGVTLNCTNSVTVTNSATETTVFSAANYGSTNTAAGFWTNGRMFEIVFSGITTDPITPDALQFAFYVGANVVSMSSSAALLANSANVPFDGWVRAIQTSPTNLFVTMKVEFGQGTALGDKSLLTRANVMVPSATAAINLTAKWAAATSGESITIDPGVYIRVLR
jgi:hypothetical protein